MSSIRRSSGKGDLLKERLIGVQLFGRKPDYATGRGSRGPRAGGRRSPAARELPRRPRQRIRDADRDSGGFLRARLPSREGSPSPAGGPCPSASETAGLPRPGSSRGRTIPDVGKALRPGRRLRAPECTSLDLIRRHRQHSTAKRRLPAGGSRGRRSGQSRFPGAGRIWRLGLAALALDCARMSALAVACSASVARADPEGVLASRFGVSSKPVLICLPRAVVYRPSEKLYDQYAATHPNTFTTREERRDHVLPLPPTTPICSGAI